MLISSYFTTCPGVGVGGWGKAGNKAKLRPAGAGSLAELGKNRPPGGRGAPENLFYPKSYFFGDLKPHAKFRNLTITTSELTLTYIFAVLQKPMWGAYTILVARKLHTLC